MEQVPTFDEIQFLYKKVTQLLIENKLTITTMESCTSGFIASLITDTPGASSILKGACITYSNEAKILCGVDESIITEYGVYSKETSTAMAKAALKNYPSDISIGVTGTFTDDEFIPGEVYTTVIFREKEITKKITLPTKISRFEAKAFVSNIVGRIILTELDFL